MNIDEIRAEIDWAFSPISSTVTWIRANGKPEYSGKVPNVFINYRTAAHMLIDWAYEAGKAETENSLRQIAWSEFGEKLFKEEYNKGYEAGKHDTEMAIRGMIPTCEEEYKRGYNDAAKEPKAWYVLDKHGEQAHIGDDIIDSDGELEEIFAIADNVIFDSCGIYHDADKCEKVIPDTREKIKQEIVDAIENDGDQFSNPDDLAEQFISRIEALAVDE